MKREPVLIILGGLAGLVNLGLIAANAIGWTDLTAQAITAVVAFVTAACGLSAAALHGTVDSPATVEAKVTTALYTPPPPGAPPLGGPTQ